MQPKAAALQGGECFQIAAKAAELTEDRLPSISPQPAEVKAGAC